MGDDVDQLVGRGREQALLVDALDGPAGLIEVCGEPGIGKSRLLRELHARASDRGHLVLDGRGAEFETSVPFGMFVDAIDGELAGLDPERLAAAIGAEHTAELAQVFPSLAALAGEGPRGLEAERFKAHFAVRRLLEHLAADRPVLLMLDDVHWADPASVELLALLLRRPPRGPVLLTLAHRPHQTAPGLARSLDRAGREPTARRLELGPLSAAEVDELLGDGMSAAARAALYRESGGNVFYVEQLARGWDLEGAPPAVAAAIEAELTSLPRRARKLLEGAAVAGETFDPEL